jgi:hypothetical protein
VIETLCFDSTTNPIFNYFVWWRSAVSAKKYRYGWGANMGKAIAEIGESKICMMEPTIKGAKEALMKNGYEGAEAYAAQLGGTDDNIELLRVLMIAKKYNLGTEAATKVLDNLTKIESGKW